MANADSYIYYLNNSSLLKTVCDLLRSFCYLELVLLDSAGLVITGKSPHSRRSGQTRANQSDFCRRCLHMSSQCTIDIQVINQDFGQEGFTIFSNKDGYQKILVPITVNGKILGYFYTGECVLCQLMDFQVDCVAVFLRDLAGQIASGGLSMFKGAQGGHRTHRGKTIHKVLAYIEEHYASREMTLKKVAEDNAVAYHYLSRLFRQELSTSFTKHVNDVRTGAAARLLKDMSLSIGEIAYACGYDDPGYFCKVFKRIHGVAPAQYRAEFRRKKMSYRRKQVGSDKIRTVLPHDIFSLSGPEV